jgi:predicted ATPase/DNA-binding winged helix-turn-helix (wHTH) protein
MPPLNQETAAPTRPPIGDARPSGDEAETVFAFGEYRVFPRQRRFLGGRAAIELGSRAFDVLMALVEAEGRLVAKSELRKRVWPSTVVDDHNIEVQISALRKALGGDRDLIRTEAGRGYRLAATITLVTAGSASMPPGSTSLAARPPMTNLPTTISSLVGRGREVPELLELVETHRLVTLTGAGGIGKTQLGLEVARLALPGFADGARVAELGPLVDPELILDAIARALGIESGFNRRPADQLAAVLGRKRLLLMLDNCEHVVESAARIAETLLRGAPGLHILATSQEPLAAEGERVYRVTPLEVPVTDGASAALALEHSAVELFVERAQAVDPSFVLDDHTASHVSKICRQLDGIPLTIELAAARVATIGVEALAARLDDRFRLLTGGRRTALPRHHTLRATLDWSYGLLLEAERAVLRRIAIFSGSFTLDGAGAVAAGGPIDGAQAANHVTDLVSKSLVTFDVRGSLPRYRLLETTRAYALDKLAESGEFAAVVRRHARYYHELLEAAAMGWHTAPARELAAQYAPEIDNIRAALAWAFEPQGDAEIGIALAAASVPLWALLSMLGECRDLAGRALARLARGPGGQTRQEMVLQVALGKSSIWANGPAGTSRIALQRAIDLAEQVGDAECLLQALHVMWGYVLRLGEFGASLDVAERFCRVAEKTADRAAALIGTRLKGVSLYYFGEHAAARAAMERVLDASLAGLYGASMVRFGLDQRIAAFGNLARILWLQGFPEQAARAAASGVAEARALNHANSLCVALCDGACGLAALAGEVHMVEELATTLIDCAEKHGLEIWRSDGLAFKGWVAVRRGDNELGIHLLRRTFDSFRAKRVELRYTIFVEALVSALAASGRLAEGMAVIEQGLDGSSRHERRWCIPELLRIRGELALGDSRAAEAERDFVEAIDLARQQDLRSWQLRAATSLAGLQHRQGRAAEARDLLDPIYRSFSEGSCTRDLMAAKALLDAMSSRHSGAADR